VSSIFAVYIFNPQLRVPSTGTYIDRVVLLYWETAYEGQIQKIWKYTFCHNFET